MIPNVRKTAPTPDPSPRAAQRPVPPGACDCHTHVHARPERYPYAAGRPYDPAPGDLEDYLARHAAMHAALGIARAVLVHSNVYGEDNGVTREALRAQPQRLRGIALLDPRIRPAELRGMAEDGFVGCRINPVYPGRMGLGDVEAMGPVLADLGWHLEVQADTGILPGLADRLVALPVPVVIDHTALASAAAGIEDPGFQVLLRQVGDGRLWAKLSCVYHISDDPPGYAGALPFTRALVAANPERLVWGSNWPHPHPPGGMPNDGDLLNHLAEAVPDDASWRAILSDNPARLYGFPPA